MAMDYSFDDNRPPPDLDLLDGAALYDFKIPQVAPLELEIQFDENDEIGALDVIGMICRALERQPDVCEAHKAQLRVRDRDLSDNEAEARLIYLVVCHWFEHHLPAPMMRDFQYAIRNEIAAVMVESELMTRAEVGRALGLNRHAMSRLMKRRAKQRV